MVLIIVSTLLMAGKQSRTDTPQFSADPETLVFKLEVGQGDSNHRAPEIWGQVS